MVAMVFLSAFTTTLLVVGYLWYKEMLDLPYEWDSILSSRLDDFRDAFHTRRALVVDVRGL